MQIDEMLSFPCLICSKCSKNAWNSEMRLNLKQCLRWSLFITNMLKVLRNAWNSEIRLNLKQWLRIGGFIDYICAVLLPSKMGSNIISFTQNLFIQILDSNRQPVYYYNEHGQVEIVVITLKEFFKLTFLSFGIPNANRWGLNASDCQFLITNMLKVLRNTCKSEIRLILKQCLRFPLFHHKDAQNA